MRIRPTARILVIDDQQRILLFHIHDTRPVHEAFPEMIVYWITPGGGIEPEETVEQAARRELWEETGIEVEEVGPCVLYYERIINGDIGRMLLQERFFVVRVPTSVVSMSNMLDYEHETHRGYHWWTLQELAATQDYILPPNLSTLLSSVLADELPAEPLRLTV